MTDPKPFPSPVAVNIYARAAVKNYRGTEAGILCDVVAESLEGAGYDTEHSGDLIEEAVARLLAVYG